MFENKFNHHVKAMSIMLADMAHFVHPQIVKYIQQKNQEQYSEFENMFCGERKITHSHYLFPGSACVFPGFRRPPASIKGPKLQYNKELSAILDDNWAPRHIWCFLSMNKCFTGRNWKDNELNKFELAHLFPHKEDTANLQLVKKVFSHVKEHPNPFGNFSAANNVILLPKGSVKPTDESEQIKLTFFYRHILLYGEESLPGSMRGFKRNLVPDWYGELRWNEPKLPDDWEKRIDNLINYRMKYIKKILSLNGEPKSPIAPVTTPGNSVELTEENVLRIIRDNPGIHTSAIRNALNLQEIDPKVWKTHALVKQLEIEGKIRSEKINNKRCWRIVPPTPH